MSFEIIDIGKHFGTMNVSSVSINNLNNADKFHLYTKFGKLADVDSDLTVEMKRSIFDRHRREMARCYGLDAKKIFVAEQKKKNGSSFILTRDFVEATTDGWDVEIPEDILIITDKIPGVVAGHPVADCPVIMAMDMERGVAAVAHCGAELIDKKMPMMLIDALQRTCNSRENDIFTYISACAGSDWTYDTYPSWATDRKLWDEAIREVNGVFQINMREVILKQLQERGISFVDFNMDNTRTSPEYYSNSMASVNGGNDPKKAGRGFAGAYFKPKVKTLVLEKTR